MQHYLKQLKGANNPNVHEPEREGTGESLLNGYRTYFEVIKVSCNLIISQYHECIKCHRIAHSEMAYG